MNVTTKTEMKVIHQNKFKATKEDGKQLTAGDYRTLTNQNGPTTQWTSTLRFFWILPKTSFLVIRTKRKKYQGLNRDESDLEYVRISGNTES